MKEQIEKLTSGALFIAFAFYFVWYACSLFEWSNAHKLSRSSRKSR